MKRITPWFAFAVLPLFVIFLFSSATDPAEASDVAGSATPAAKVQQVTVPQIQPGLSFAGIPLPLARRGVRERMDRELLAVTFRHSTTILTLKRASRWFPVIEPILAEAGIPDDFKYLAVIESGLSHAVSPVGAKGFWQFMPGSARDHGLEVTGEVDQRYHVELATRSACEYLQEAYERYDNWLLASASYNMGKAGVSKSLDAQGGSAYWDLNLNRETARYVYRLYATKQIMSDPAAHGFSLSPSDLWGADLPTRDTLVTATIASLSDFASRANLSYNELKLLNPWLISDNLPVAQGASYTLLLPL